MMSPVVRQRLLHDAIATLVSQSSHTDVPEINAAVQAVSAQSPTTLTSTEQSQLVTAVAAEIMGAGRLEHFFDNPTITDVMVNSPDDVWVDGAAGLQRTTVSFPSDADVRNLATRLALRCGRRLDDAHPYADGFYQRPDGRQVRVHAVIPPLSPTTYLSLRAQAPEVMSIAQLVQSGTIPQEMASHLRLLVHAGVSFLITGGTGVGKTTLLTALLSEVPASERLLCVEDTREVRNCHPQLLSLTTREANSEGSGCIDLAVLVRQALRMRPDRLIVGEIRGAECAELLRAMNTGHEGGAATLHSNGLSETVIRIQSLAALAGLSADVTWPQLCGAFRVVLHLRRSGRRRWLSAIGVLPHPRDSGTDCGNRRHIIEVWNADDGPTHQWGLFQQLIDQSSTQDSGDGGENACPSSTR